MSDAPVIAVDFDDTIATSGEVYPLLGPPQDGVREALLALRGLGCRIRIHTCRCNGQSRDNGMLEVECQRIVDYMTANDLPYDDIVLPEEGKPFASFYVDNKGVHYGGDWVAVLNVIQNALAKQTARDRQVGYEMIVDRLAIARAKEIRKGQQL